MANAAQQIIKGLTYLGSALRNHPRLALLATSGAAYPTVKGVQEIPNLWDKGVYYVNKKLDNYVHARDEIKESVKNKLEAEKKLQELKNKKNLDNQILASRAASQPQEVTVKDEPISSQYQIENTKDSTQEKDSDKTSTSNNKEQVKDTAKKEEAAQESVVRGNNEQQKAEEAAKALTLGNFFDYTNPYFQYYTAPTALGLGLGGLLGGWKGSLLGAAGGAGLGALAKYLVDNDKIHMA